MTNILSPFRIRLVKEERFGPAVTAEDRLRGRHTSYTFDLITDYRRQRYVVVSGNIDQAYRDLEDEVNSAIVSEGRTIPSCTAFDPGQSERFANVETPALFTSPASNAALVLAGAATVAGYGLIRLLTHWQENRVIEDVGYDAGRPFAISLVKIDGKPVQVDTAHAFKAMREAARAQGIKLTVVSGFRTMGEQRRLYRCYLEGNCNNGNLAAKPGYSNHQGGAALDLNSRGPGVLVWLRARAREFGFSETIASEPWHWERVTVGG